MTTGRDDKRKFEQGEGKSTSSVKRRIHTPHRLGIPFILLYPRLLQVSLAKIASFLDLGTFTNLLSPLSLAWKDAVADVPAYMWRSEIGDRVLNFHAPFFPFWWYIRNDVSLCKSYIEVILAHPVTRTHRRVDVSYIYSVSDETVRSVANPNLTSLNLNGCNNITDNGLENLTNIPLTSLFLGTCTKLTDSGLKHLERMPLASLNLMGCRNITDAGIANLAGLSSTLTSLSLRGCCDNITDAGLVHISKLKQLTSLDIAYCELVTDVGIANLTTLSLTLTFLDLGGCYGTTVDGLANLTKMLKLTRINTDCEARQLF
jgi:hypothetical protein